MTKENKVGHEKGTLEQGIQARVVYRFREFLSDPDDPSVLLTDASAETNDAIYKGAMYDLPGASQGSPSKDVYALMAQEKVSGKVTRFVFERRNTDMSQRLAINDRFGSNLEDWAACEQALVDAISGRRSVRHEA